MRKPLLLLLSLLCMVLAVDAAAWVLDPKGQKLINQHVLILLGALCSVILAFLQHNARTFYLLFFSGIILVIANFLSGLQIIALASASIVFLLMFSTLLLIAIRGERQSHV